MPGRLYPFEMAASDEVSSVSSMSDVGDENHVYVGSGRVPRPEAQPNTGGYEGLFVSEFEKFMWTRNEFDVPKSDWRLVDASSWGRVEHGLPIFLNCGGSAIATFKFEKETEIILRNKEVLHVYKPKNPLFNQFVVRQVGPPLVVAWRFIPSPYKADDVLVDFWFPGMIREPCMVTG